MGAFGLVYLLLSGSAEEVAPIGIPEYFIIGIILIGFVGLSVGLWKLRNWARRVAIGIYVVASISSVIQLFLSVSSGSSDIVEAASGLVICGVVVWYLFRPHVKEAFGLQHES